MPDQQHDQQRASVSDNSTQLTERLQLGLNDMRLQLEAAQVDSLIRFVALLVKWNRVYNLTAVRDPVAMISRHLLDSLSLVPHITGVDLLDIGSGAGLPGIPVAIARPDLDCTLLDSNSKKTRFIQQVVAELGISNVSVVHARVEDAVLAPSDTLVSRAFSSPVDIINAAGHLCAPGGSVVFMLGHTGDLLDSLPSDYQLTSLEPVQIPFETGTRHIAVCQHQAAG